MFDIMNKMIETPDTCYHNRNITLNRLHDFSIHSHRLDSILLIIIFSLKSKNISYVFDQVNDEITYV